MFIERSLSKPKTGSEGISKKGLVFPLLATITWAFSSIFRKQGLNIYNEPLLGVALGYFFSLLLYLLLPIFSDTMRSSVFSYKDFRFAWKAGACSSLGWVLSFYALSYEKVSIVTPLMQVNALFVLFFAYIYLKEFEHVSIKLVISTLLVVIGAMLASVRIEG